MFQGKMRIRHALVGVATLLAMLVVPMPTADAVDGVEAYITRYANDSRSRAGLANMSNSWCLEKYAQPWANKLARERKMYHRSTYSLKWIMNKCGMRHLGENLAYGYTSPWNVHKAWMNSSGHRANIMYRTHYRTAPARAKASNGVWYWVALYGTPG